MSEYFDIVLPSSLFRFSRKDIAHSQYGPYSLQNVYGTISQEQRQACVDLWLRNRVIPSEPAAWQRSLEVCYFITESGTGKLVGVNTLYEGVLDEQRNKAYFNRMFLAPAFRNSRLMIRATALMLCFAKLRLSESEHLGVVNVNENRKLDRPGMQRIFERLGYSELGYSSGQRVLLFDFDRVRISEHATKL